MDKKRTEQEQNEEISRLQGVIDDLSTQLRDKSTQLADKEAAMRELRALEAIVKLKYPKTYGDFTKGREWESHPMAMEIIEAREQLKQEAVKGHLEETKVKEDG